MKDTLDSLQVLFRVLLTAALAIWAFVFSFQPEQPLLAASKEVGKLMQAMDRSGGTDGPVEQKRASFCNAQYRAQSNFASLLLTTARSLNVDANHVTFFSEEADNPDAPPGLRKFIQDSSKSSPTIDDYYKYLNDAKDSDQLIIYSYVDVDKASKSLTKLLASLVDLLHEQTPNNHSSIILKYADIGPAYSRAPTGPEAGRRIQGECDVQIDGVDQMGNEVSNATIAGQSIPCKIVAHPTFAGAWEMLVSSHLVQHTQRQYKLTSIWPFLDMNTGIDQHLNEFQPMPKLIKVWDSPDVHTETPFKAKQSLELEVDKIGSASTLTLFGISVKSLVATSIAVAVELSLLLLILAHLIHIDSLKEHETKELREHPLFGVMLNWPGKIAMVGCVMILPLVATDILIIVTGGTLGRQIVSLIFVSALYIALSAAIFNRVRAILTYLKADCSLPELSKGG